MIYIKWTTTQEIDEIYFPINFPGIEMPSSSKIKLQFGLWEKELTVQFSEDLAGDQIGLSENLREEVLIPDDLLYKINITEDSLCLGPVILYVVSKRMLKRLGRIKKRFKHLDSINGLIIVCTVSGINIEENTIKGYYLQPKTNKKKSNWKEGIFQYPEAVFKRKGLPRKINNHLYKVTNGQVFNSIYFDKWEMWQWLSPNEFIRNHLPHTVKLKNLAEIYKMIDIYPSIYLKPKGGSQGKGIIEIKREDDLYQITDDKNRATMVEYNNIGSHKSIKRVLEIRKKYLIQQGVPVKHDSRNVDFRIYMQKDETKQWKCTGFITRFAKPESITTNLQHLDYLLPGKEALVKLFEKTPHDVKLLERNIVNVCVEACKILDENGCYGDLAVDFILDNDLHVWILEMNKKYGYRSFSIIKDPKLYGRVIRNPFLYASALAGFSSNNEPEKIEKGLE
ncbi:MAG: YheC/YheD family protein [Paenisporosarcina sp.]